MKLLADSMFCRPLCSRFYQRGFSLVELLVVMAVVAVVIGLSAGALVEAARGQGMKRAIADLGGLVEQGRVEAMGTSTWTWVGLRQQNSGADTELLAVLVASKDGSTNRNSSNLRMVSRPLRIKNVKILTALTKWGETVDGAVSAADGTGDFGFSQTISGQSVTFSDTVGFSSRGEAAMNNASVPPWIEIGLQETRGQVAITNKTASIRVSGFSGQLNVDY